MWDWLQNVFERLITECVWETDWLYCRLCLRDWSTILTNVFERLNDFIKTNVFERLINYITECVWETDWQYHGSVWETDLQYYRMCLRDWLTILTNVFERLIKYITECV